MKKNKILSLLIIIVIISLIFAYFNSNPLNNNANLKIGVIAPLSGDAAMYGKSLQDGINVAKILFSELNPNVSIQVLIEDSEAQPSKAVSAINKLISVDKVDWVIGDMFTTTTLAIAPIAQKNNILLLSPTGSSSEISNSGSNIFRIYPSEIEEAQFLINFNKINYNNSNIAIIWTNEAAMNNMSKTITEEFKEKVKYKETFDKSIVDFKTIISDIPNSCEIVYFVGYINDAANFIIQSCELNKRYKIIGISTLYDPKLIELVKCNTLDVFFTAPFFSITSEDSITKKFVSKYNNLYGKNPDVWAGYGFDAFNITMQAWEESRKSKINISEAMKTIINFNGVTGMTTINQNHTINKKFNIIKLTPKGFEIIN